MTKQEITLMILQMGLTQFGLNPAEWTLHKVSALKFVLQNKMDKNFLMRGNLEYKNKKAQWRSMELVSL